MGDDRLHVVFGTGQASTTGTAVPKQPDQANQNHPD